jgi:hypothetical protein
MHTPTAAEMIRALDLKPHPEGGHYRETFRDPRLVEGRSASTAILFLLARGERSHWHRIDAVEIWHYYAGAPLKLSLVDGPRLAGRGKPRAVDAHRLYCRARLLLRGFRARTQRLVAAMMRSWPGLFRPSASCFIVVTMWMAGTGPGMTN